MDVLASIETVMDSDLVHHGRKGQKWGVRNGPPYPLHPEQLSSAEKKARRSVFISGSSKTQDPESWYYRHELPKAIQNKIDEYMQDHAYIVVGDAPGIDRQVQDYLNEKGYDAVEVYGPGKQVRYTANEKWKTNPVDAPEFEEMSPEWLRKKDIAMTNDATEGLAIVLDEGAKATRNNVERLREQGKAVDVYVLTGDYYDFSGWETEPGSYQSQRMKYRDERTAYAQETQEIIDDILSTWDWQDEKWFNTSTHEPRFELVKRGLAKTGEPKEPKTLGEKLKQKFTNVSVDDVASFCDLVDYGSDYLNVEIGTKHGDKYRNKGYGYKAAKEALDWVEQNKYSELLKDYDRIVWQAYADNYGSIKIAEKLGFDTKEEYTNSWGENEVRFEKKIRHSDFAEFVNPEDLEHHGIKGMKWGHRNGPPYPLDQDTHDKVVQGKDTGVYKKGSKFHRVTFEEHEDMAKTDYKYVTSLKEDRDVYKGPNAIDWMYDEEEETLEEFTNHTIQEICDNFAKRGFKLYEITLEAKTDLKSPSKSERQRMLKELIDEDPTIIDRTHNFFKKDQLTLENREKVEATNRAFDKKRWTRFGGSLSDLAYDPDAFRYFSEVLNDVGDIRRQYFDKVKKSGYNMIVDDHDAGSLSERPFIVIDPIETLTQVYAEELSGKSIEKSFRRWERAQDWYTEDEKSFVGHSDFLSHHGVQGQQWGVRHWQNPDGTLTPAGRERWINSLKYEAYQAAKKWEEYQKVRKQVVDMHYNGQFDSKLEKQMRDLKEEANKAGAIWGFLKKRVESYLENGPESSTSEPATDAPHKVLVAVGDEERYKHFLDLGYVEKGRNDTWIYMINTDKYIRY